MINTYNNMFTRWHDVIFEFTGVASRYHRCILWYIVTGNASGAFEKIDAISKFPEPDKVYYADYNYDSIEYNAMAVVIWRDKGKYYYLEGSHCSCYGLEETGFNPEVFETKELFLAYLERFDPRWLKTNKDDLIKLIKEDD